MTPALQRLFSLTGVVPLGLFLVEHLGVCGAALFGPRAFVAAVTWLDAAPLLHVLEVVFIFAPLVVHAGLGVWLMATRRTLPERPYSRAMSLAMRATAVVALVFVAYHVWSLRVRGAGAGADEMYSRVQEELSATWWFASAGSAWRGVPLVALGYLVGVACTVFHFVAGLWAAGAAWKRSARVGWACAALGVVLVLVGANTVIAFATGSRYFAPGSFTPVEVEGGRCGGSE